LAHIEGFKDVPGEERQQKDSDSRSSGKSRNSEEEPLEHAGTGIWQELAQQQWESESSNLYSLKALKQLTFAMFAGCCYSQASCP
jgi:hypothetical protein